MKKIAVIIPYFQREEGILSRALTSIKKQNFEIEHIEVVVVDDGSPVPAKLELDKNWDCEDLTVIVLEKSNSGPNEARNMGLEYVQKLDHIDYIAYLDSDDEWTANHLNRAVNALGCGYSVYFANLIHLGHEKSTYQEAGTLDISMHPALGEDDTIRVYKGNMSNQIVTDNIMFIPSMVVDKKTLGHVRFPKSHRFGGGDYLYWLALTEAGASYVFSTEPEVNCGRGINMWYASDWGTEGLSRRLMDEARFRRLALNKYITDNDVKTRLKNRLTELQIVFVLDFLHRVKRRKKIDWSTLRTFWKEQPPTGIFIKNLFKRIFSRS